MKTLKVSVDIKASRDQIWKIITDIEGSVDRIRGIDKVEILEKPADSFVGLKWRETRTMFGQTATEVMWITDAVEHTSYSTRAESHGAVYTTRFDLTEEEGYVTLSMTFGAELIKTMTKIVSALTGWMFAGATKKALLEDLEDIKKAAEAT
ncbi:MAG: SRPBCC family protein [Spirochaetales bacterium]|nr:SRPBCC family protein [Spirochaetales bacterium]